MKRFNLESEIVEHIDQCRDLRQMKIRSAMRESDRGEWVRWEDVEALREFLENQIPDRRIEKLEKALGLVHEGKCPECERRVRDFKPIFGGLAPEAWATFREQGIDPVTGHKMGCSMAPKK